MSAATERPCAACVHVQYLAEHADHYCLHPEVAQPSAVSGKPIGVLASAVRYSAYCLDRRRCGPGGLWFDPAPVQESIKQSRDPGATGYPNQQQEQQHEQG